MGILRDRAIHFLKSIIPFEGYTSETQVEDFIRRYIAGGPWDGPELHDDLRLCYTAVLDELHGKDYPAYPKPQRDYVHGCAEVLREIMLEIYGEAKPYEDLG